jgi:hypothetical protein
LIGNDGYGLQNGFRYFVGDFGCCFITGFGLNRFHGINGDFFIAVHVAPYIL